MWDAARLANAHPVETVKMIRSFVAAADALVVGIGGFLGMDAKESPYH